MSWELAWTASLIPAGGGRGSGSRWYRSAKRPRTGCTSISVSVAAAVPIETRRQRVDAEAARLADLGALLVGVLNTEGLDHYAVAMKDPEGTISAPGSHGMIPIERGVDIKNATYRVNLAGVDP